MEKKININMVIILTVYMLSGWIAYTIYSEIISNFSFFFIILPFFVITLIVFSRKKLSFNIPIASEDRIYYLFIFFGILSSITVGDLSNLNIMISNLIIYIILIIFPYNNKNYKECFLAFLFAGLITLALSIISPSQYIKYTDAGIFGNPNSRGIFGATLFILLFGLIIKYYREKKYKQLTIILLLSVYMLYIIIDSGSRTSLLSVVIILILNLLLYLINIIKSNRLTKSNFQSLLIIAIASCIIIFFIFNSELKNFIDENIIEKFLFTRGDTLSGRGEIWKNYLENSTFYGRKLSYWENSIGLEAHNTFIQMIGRFGYFSGFLYIIFWVVVLFKTLKYYFKHSEKDSNSTLIISGILFFIIVSITEVVSNIQPVYFALLCLGYVKIYDQNENSDTYEISGGEQ